ncbi:MAG: protein phosphatase 2C domain-containing protein [Chthonomonadales bacterium]|nr:protein phosphatase 2C domain-containing protein [Chthonomonadales bacterium]
MQGVSHRAAGRRCDDAFGWVHAGPVTCLVVADGAGSRPLAAEGSRAAVSAVLDRVLAAGDTAELPDVYDLFSSALNAVTELACQTHCRLGDYATTMAVALLSPAGASIAQIGDSIVVVRSSVEGAIRTVDPQEPLEYANETHFLTSPDAREHLRVAFYPDREVSAVAMATDGLQLKILENPVTGEPFVPFFEDAFAFATQMESTSREVEEFLDGLENDQTGDDKTLVLAVPGTPTASRCLGPEDPLQMESNLGFLATDE